MGHQFEAENTVDVPASPAEVWDAIATGPGFDSWYMGRNELRDGTWRMTCFGDYTPEFKVSAWDPGKRAAYGTGTADDGRFIAYDFLIEGREHGSTTLRMVTSGFLPGDDWADEYEAMTKGGALFFATLAAYLKNFAGRSATPVTAFGPMITDWQSTRARLHAELGLSAEPAVGDHVDLRPEGLPPIDGVVYHVNEHALGVRTDDALYRFLRGFHGPIIAAHHLFTTTDTETTESAWANWLQRTFA